MTGWTKVREHIWRDEHGAPVLRHTKWLLPNGDVAFPWEHWVDFGNGTRPRWYDGDGKKDGIPHPLIYPRDVFAQTPRDAAVLICEGEADVEAAQQYGLLAFTAGHAGAFGRAHARLFRRWRGGITIVRDRDLAGAAGALRAFDELRAVGIPGSRLRVCRGRSVVEGGDLRDHLERHPVERLVTERVDWLRKYVERTSVATKSTNTVSRSGSSGNLVRDSDGFLVNPHTGFVVAGPTEGLRLKAGERP